MYFLAIETSDGKAATPVTSSKRAGPIRFLIRPHAGGYLMKKISSNTAVASVVLLWLVTGNPT